MHFSTKNPTELRYISMEETKRKKVLVIGVIGADVHAVGNKILYHAFT